MVKVLINLSKDVIEILDLMAKKDLRSRKNYIEKILSLHAEQESNKIDIKVKLKGNENNYEGY